MSIDGCILCVAFSCVLRLCLELFTVDLFCVKSFYWCWMYIHGRRALAIFPRLTTLFTTEDEENYQDSKNRI